MNLSCLHCFTNSDKVGYRFCHVCGTYRSRLAPEPAEVYTPDYWTEERGHSTLTDQVYNVDVHTEGGMTKAACALAHIEVEDRRGALEIGCAPGTMLRWLKEAGFRDVVGIDTCEEWDADIRKTGAFAGNLYYGLFPEVTAKWAPSYSLVMALDVFEHSPTPAAFLTECARLLRPDGQVLLMLPIITLEGPPMPDRFFEPTEHVFIHTRENMEAMMTDAGFRDVRFGAWCPGHETVTGRRI